MAQLVMMNVTRTTLAPHPLLSPPFPSRIVEVHTSGGEPCLFKKGVCDRNSTSCWTDIRVRHVLPRFLLIYIHHRVLPHLFSFHPSLLTADHVSCSYANTTMDRKLVIHEAMFSLLGCSVIYPFANAQGIRNSRTRGRYWFH